MSRGQDNTIDEAVVKIHPDLSTFNAELKKALGKQALLKDQPVYKVKVVPNASGLRDLVRKAVAAQMLLKNQPVYKVKVVADAKGLKKSLADVGDITTKAAKKNTEELTKAHAKATRERREADRKAEQKSLAKGMAYALKLQFKAIEKNLDLIRNANEKHQRDELAAREAEYKRQNTRIRNLAEKAQKDLLDALDAERKRHRSRARNEAEEDERTRGEAEAAERKRNNTQIRSQDEKDQKARNDADAAERKRNNTQIRSEDEKHEKARIDAVGADLQRTIKKNVGKQRADETYLNFQRYVDKELAQIQQDRALDEIGLHYQTADTIAKIDREADRLKIALLANQEKAEKASQQRTEEAEKASAKRRADTTKALTKSQKFIDYGGEGVKPLNALYGVVAAMTPALFAMGASAVQASTSIAALGSAGIGAALGLSGVMVAFQGIGDLFGLRKQVQNEQATTAANSARSAAELAQQRRSLADALRDEKTAAAGVHDARREAIRDLEDLRTAVRDLDNEYKSRQISVAEAEQNERATNANYFATALDRARAHQDTLDARTQLSDTALQRKRKKEDLKTSVAKGVEGSDKVAAAKERVRDAHDATLNARDTLAKTGGSMSKTSSAAAQLEKKLKDMSPAARDMWKWFLKNEDLFKRLQRQISQQVLPGFTKFLTAVTAAPKGGKSTLQLAAEYAGELGAVISKYAGLFGEFTQSPLFRGSMARIQKTNAEAFDLLGKALLALADPITRILDKAAPGFLELADAIDRMATKLADFIRTQDANGGLAKWFEDSRREAKKWFDIAGNILELLKNLFVGSLPAGHSLVTDFQAFTQTLADWSGSAKGQKQIGDFFAKFRDLPYAKIADFFKNATAFFVVFRAGAFLKGLNPIMLLLGTIAAANPGATADLFALVFTGLTNVVEYISDHPKATATLLAVLAAAKLGKTIGLDIKIPVMDGLRNALTSKFKVLEQFVGGGANTATMTVHAGMVNIYGGGAPGTPGTTPGATPVPGSTKPGKLAPGTFANLGLSLGLGVGAAVVDQMDTTKSSPFAQALQSTVSGGLSGAALGTMVGGPIGTAIGAAIGSAVGLAVQQWQVRAEKLSTATGRENEAFKEAKRIDFADPKLGLTVSQAANLPEIQKYIKLRKESVAVAVENKRLTDGDEAARRLDVIEGQRSARALQDLINMHTTDTVASEKYSRAIFDVNGAIYRVNQDLYNAKGAAKAAATGIEDVGAKAKKAEVDLGVLSDRLDTMTGVYKVILDIDGEEKVFATLEGAVAYQQAIRMGVEPNPGVVEKLKRQFAKQSDDPNLSDSSRRSKDLKAITSANGGIIPGYSPNKRADNIPAMLTAKEYVQPVAAVEHYGTDFMEAVRTRQFPKFAAGGPVKWPFPVKMPDPLKPVAKYLDTTPVPDVGGGTPTGSVKVAEIAEATARSMGASTKQLVALIAAGIVESGLRNINYGDRDSVGFLQQRPSQGWGTVTQLLDPAYATRKFMNAAKRMDTADITAGELAARIQRPAARYRGRYAERQADAVAVLNRNPPFLTSASPGGNKVGLVAFGRWLQARGYDVSEHPAFGGVHGGHVDGSQHYRNQAIDVNHGAGTSAREQAFLRKILPEAHRRGFRSIFMTAGHYNHAHFDLGRGHADGGPVRKYDNGGVLPPGYSLAFNGTGQNETIRTDKQEKALSATRLDRRDLALLAQFMAGAVGNPTISMDGRKVAETTNRYNYLPTGV